MKKPVIFQFPKLNFHKFFFIRHKEYKSWFIHHLNGMPVLLEGFEGAVWFNEKNTGKILKRCPRYEAVSIYEMSRELPVFISFPKGHELENVQIEVRNDVAIVKDRNATNTTNTF